jgi:phosphatidate cytidylyltransferase
MLKTRFFSALVFVPLTLLMIFIGGIPYYIYIAIILGVATWEYWRLFKTMGFNPSLFVFMGGIFAFFLHRIIFGIKYADILLCGILFLVALYALVRYEQGDEDASLNFALHLGGILVLGWVGSFFITTRTMPDGRWWMLLAIPINWLADMGGYTIGKPWGRHKMVPRLSPNKSWEGYAGGILFGMVSGVLLSFLWHIWMPGMLWWHGLVMGVVISASTILGDLLISLFKRSARVKDTGNLIPGHGGFLDRIDTWIWAAMIGYYTALFLSRF